MNNDFSKIIFISDGYKGGNSTFLEQNILHLLKYNKKIILIDPNPEITFPKLKQNQNLEVFKLNAVKDRRKIKDYLINIRLDKNFIFFTNFSILFYYFYEFFFYHRNSSKIALALHSGVFNYKIRTVFGLIIFSLISFKLNYIVYGSYSSKNWWLKFFPWMNLIKNKVIFNGVQKNSKIKKKKKFINISFIGRLEKENDPELFFKIYLLNKNNKKLRFNIFGDGSLKKFIFQNKNNLRFWGWSRKDKIYNNTDITLITSPTNNFPYVALESHSYGIPVITAANGDIRKIIKDKINGYILNKRTAENFNNYINKVIKNYDYLSKNSKINVEKFDINISCKKIWNFLEVKM